MPCLGPSLHFTSKEPSDRSALLGSNTGELKAAIRFCWLSCHIALCFGSLRYSQSLLTSVRTDQKGVLLRWVTRLGGGTLDLLYTKGRHLHTANVTPKFMTVLKNFKLIELLNYLLKLVFLKKVVHSACLKCLTYHTFIAAIFAIALRHTW